MRCFEDDNVVHVAGRVDPMADVETIETELALADLETLTRGQEKAQKLTRSGDKTALSLVADIDTVLAGLNEMRPVRVQSLSEDVLETIRPYNLLTAKPAVFVANVDEDSVAGNDMSQNVQAYAEAQGAEVVVLCASLESELASLEDQERDEFLGEMGLDEPGLNRFIRAGYQLLGLQTYFTAGPKECRAWTVRCGATAPKAAAVIHTDFEKGFIRAEVISYQDFVELGGEAGAQKPVVCA